MGCQQDQFAATGRIYYAQTLRDQLGCQTPVCSLLAFWLKLGQQLRLPCYSATCPITRKVPSTRSAFFPASQVHYLSYPQQSETFLHSASPKALETSIQICSIYRFNNHTFYFMMEVINKNTEETLEMYLT